MVLFVILLCLVLAFVVKNKTHAASIAAATTVNTLSGHVSNDKFTRFSLETHHFRLPS